MASFTDAIPQFNPYIQQLPVEAMAQVGVAKQQRYNEGIEKIQTQIENVAGLDIIRNVDKQYLQSKLDDLGNRLKTVAAGDFSNFQLTNSVAGMTNEIAKDSYVQNAVSSTAFYRKQLADMDAARKEGKSSIVNEAFFYDRANKWINSDNLDESFNTRYKQYIDVEKKWLEVFKTLHPTLNEQDIPFVRNIDGSINTEETAKAMSRISKETVSAATIENALRASMSPDDIDQLNMNGWYQFRTYDTPEKLAVYSQTRYQSQIQNNEQRIKDLQGLANTTDDPNKKYQAEQIIKQLQAQNAELPIKMQEELDLIRTNPEAAKGYIYRTGAISQFASAYAWESNKENVLTNPIAQYELDEAKFKLQYEQFNWDKYMDQLDYDIKLKEYGLKEKEFNLKNGLTNQFETYLGQHTEKFDHPVKAMLNDASEQMKGADAIVAEMVGPDGIQGVSPEQIENAIRLYDSQDPNWYSQNGKEIIPKEWRGKIEQVIDMRNSAKRLTNALADIRTSVENSPEVAAMKAELDQKLSTLGGIDVKDSSGRSVSFTPQEIARYLEKVETVETVSGGGQLTQSRTSKTEIKVPLTEKEQLLYNNRFKVKSELTKYNNSIGKLNRAIAEKVDEAVLKRSDIYIPRVSAIAISSEDGGIQKSRMETFVTNTLMKFDEDLNSMPGGDVKMDKDDIEKIRTWFGDESRNKLIYKKLVQGDKTYMIVVNGNEEVLIPVEQREVGQIPFTDSKEPSAAYRELTLTQSLLGGTTNRSGKFEDSYFTRTSMPGIKNLQVKGDASSDKSIPGMQYITLRLVVPNYGPIALKLSDNPVDRDQVLKIINGLNDDKVKSLYLQSDKISDQIKEEIKKL